MGWNTLYGIFYFKGGKSMGYKYQKITKEEEESLKEKYEAALKIAIMLKNDYENPEEFLFNPFTFVGYFEFNEWVVQDDEKKSLFNEVWLS